jgi:hypothetical protein
MLDGCTGRTCVWAPARAGAGAGQSGDTAAILQLPCIAAHHAEKGVEGDVRVDEVVLRGCPGRPQLARTRADGAACGCSREAALSSSGRPRRTELARVGGAVTCARGAGRRRVPPGALQRNHCWVVGGGLAALLGGVVLPDTRHQLEFRERHCANWAHGSRLCCPRAPLPAHALCGPQACLAASNQQLQQVIRPSLDTYSSWPCCCPAWHSGRQRSPTARRCRSSTRPPGCGRTLPGGAADAGAAVFELLTWHPGHPAGWIVSDLAAVPGTPLTRAWKLADAELPLVRWPQSGRGVLHARQLAGAVPAGLGASSCNLPGGAAGIGCSRQGDSAEPYRAWSR